MGLKSRIILYCKVKVHDLFNGVEDPGPLLDYAYAQQQEQLRKVRVGLVEVSTSKYQLQQQAQTLRSRLPQLEDQAKRGLIAGREDLARLVLQRKQTVVEELEGLERQLSQVEGEERKLALAEQQLATRVDQFRTRRTALAASYKAAEAQVRVSESLTDITSEFAELGMALGRIEEKTEQMRARASAIDALASTGILVLSDGTDPIERDIRELEARQNLDHELTALKAQLGLGQLASALPSADQSSDQMGPIRPPLYEEA